MTHSITTNSASLLIGFAVLAVVMVLSPRAEAATLDQATFTKLQSQMEHLRGAMEKLRTSTSTRPRATSTRAVNRSCMQEAINTRESSIMQAFDAHAVAIKAAMEKRQTAFATVWSGTAVSNPGSYRQIWSQWKRDAAAARKTLQERRKAAWQTFRDTAVQSCKATLPKEETEAQDATT